MTKADIDRREIERLEALVMSRKSKLAGAPDKEASARCRTKVKEAESKLSKARERQKSRGGRRAGGR